MSKDLSAATFDYKQVDDDTRRKLICLSGQVKRGKAHYAKAAIEIGAAIHEAHELLAGDGRDGKFSDWCENECGIERRTAYNYLWSFDRFGKCETVSHFSAGAMYALAAPTAPANAVKEALKMAGNGQRVTKAVADDLIEQNTVEAKPKPSKATKSEPPPVEVEPPQVESISTDKAEPPAVKQYADTFDTATFKADAPLDLTAKQAPYDDMLNAITAIQKHWNAVTEDERDGVYAADKKNRVNALIRDLRPPIAQARPMAICDHCTGKGCKKCQNCGWWPRSVVEGLKR